jgi:hypothetical protein
MIPPHLLPSSALSFQDNLLFLSLFLTLPPISSATKPVPLLLEINLFKGCI